MRKTTKLLVLVAGGAVAALAYSGFPRRLGITKAQALVSMPGDLVFPRAEIQADRRLSLPATPDTVWPLIDDLIQGYAAAWDVSLETVYRDEPGLVVVKTAGPVVDEEHDDDIFVASLALRLVPSDEDSMVLHVRERYQVLGRRGRITADFCTLLTTMINVRWAAWARGLLRRETVAGMTIKTAKNKNLQQEGE